MKISYQVVPFGGEPVEKSIERLARYGYDGIELIGEPELMNVKKIRGYLQQYGIGASSICPMYSKGKDRDLISSSPKARRAAIDYVKWSIDMAGAIDAEIIIVTPSVSGKLKPEASLQEEWKWALETVTECAEYAARGDKIIVIEPWNRFETYFMTRLDQALKLKHDIGLDNVGVMADFFHMNIEDASLEKALRACGKDLMHIHVADSNRATPGKGHLDFHSLSRVLNEIGYRRYLVLEDLAPHPELYFPEATTKEAINEAYAREGIRFIKDILANDF